MSDLGLKNWYVYIPKDKRILGPLRQQVTFEMLKNRDIEWIDFACNPAMNLSWKRISEIEQFCKHLPQMPSRTTYEKILQAFNGNVNNVIQRKIDAWYLQFKGSKFGPLTVSEIQILMKQPQFQKGLYVWKEGMENWIPLSNTTDEGLKIFEAQSEIEMGDFGNIDHGRKADRVKLMASVQITVNYHERVNRFYGICRDISITGLYMITQVKLTIGMELGLFVVPLIGTTVEKFSVSGKVVASHRDDEGLAIEFIGLSEKSISEISSFVKSQTAK